jgi:hypothetical protein
MFCGGAKVALGGAEDGSRRENGNSEDPRMAAECTLNGTREFKMEIPVKRKLQALVRRA